MLTGRPPREANFFPASPSSRDSAFEIGRKFRPSMSVREMGDPGRAIKAVVERNLKGVELMKTESYLDLLVEDLIFELDPLDLPLRARICRELRDPIEMLLCAAIEGINPVLAFAGLEPYRRCMESYIAGEPGLESWTRTEWRERLLTIEGSDCINLIVAIEMARLALERFLLDPESADLVQAGRILTAIDRAHEFVVHGIYADVASAASGDTPDAGVMAGHPPQSETVSIGGDGAICPIIEFPQRELDDPFS